MTAARSMWESAWSFLVNVWHSVVKRWGGASDKAREMRSARRMGVERVFSSGGWGVWVSCNWFDWIMMKRSIWS